MTARLVARLIDGALAVGCVTLVIVDRLRRKVASR